MMNMTLFSHEYLQHAIIAGGCAGILCGLIGVFVVTAHLSFLGVCIAHAAFAGALMGLWLGIEPLWCGLVFSLGTATIIGPLADRGSLNPDTSTGILFSLMLGLAFLFLGLSPGPRTEAMSLLWGNILTVNTRDLYVLLATTGALLILLLLFYKEIHTVICHRETAMAVGIPATFIFYALLLSTGATIAVSLHAIGGLLIYSLILNPAAAAIQLTYNLKRTLLLSSLFGILSCWGGLAVSYMWNIPAGASIVLTSTAIFALASMVTPKKESGKWRTKNIQK